MPVLLLLAVEEELEDWLLLLLETWLLLLALLLLLEDEAPPMPMIGKKSMLILVVPGVGLTVTLSSLLGIVLPLSSSSLPSRRGMPNSSISKAGNLTVPVAQAS